MTNIKYIQSSLLCLFLLSLIACNTPLKKEGYIPREYNFPMDKIGSGKTFIYKKVGNTNDTSFCDVLFITESGTQYLITKRYGADTKFDSTKYTMDGCKIESFIWSKPNSQDKTRHFIKGEIKQNEIIDNGTKLGRHVGEIIYPGIAHTFTIKEQAEYLKDTILSWKGKQIDCLTIRIKKSSEYAKKMSPQDKHNSETTGFCYYGKGIGLLRTISRTNNDSATWELVDIKNIK